MTIKTVNFDLKDIDFVEVSVDTYKEHLRKWPKLKSYRLGDPNFEYWHEPDGKVWSATSPSDSNELARFAIRREMYQPLLGNSVIECNCFDLATVCKMLVEEKIDFKIEVSDDIVRLFDGTTCIARGPVNGMMDLSPAYDEDYIIARDMIDSIKALGDRGDPLQSDSPIYVVYGTAKVLYEH